MNGDLLRWRRARKDGMKTTPTAFSSGRELVNRGETQSESRRVFSGWPRKRPFLSRKKSTRKRQASAQWSYLREAGEWASERRCGGLAASIRKITPVTLRCGAEQCDAYARSVPARHAQTLVGARGGTSQCVGKSPRAGSALAQLTFPWARGSSYLIRTSALDAL